MSIMKDYKIDKMKLLKKIRRTWSINPSNRVKPSSKIYNRKKMKKETDMLRKY
ncbi:hypothetical protein JXL19_09275 [bacterium]|nr:hypothetical protein [bacterium]